MVAGKLVFFHDRRMNQRLLPADRTVSSVLVFTSPKAGSGIGQEQLPRLVELLGARGLGVSVTSSLDELRQRTQDIQLDQSDVPVVVAAGGDGTLSLIAENIPQGMPIVPMPLGTENLLARHFGYTPNADAVAESIVHGTGHWIDAASANAKLFLVMATCGFDAEVVRAMHLTRRGHIRRSDYAGPILRALRRYQFPKIHVRIQGGNDPQPESEALELDCCWAMAFNFPCYGGHLRVEPGADGEDGLLDVITFRKGSILSGLRYLAGIILGQHQRFGDVVRARGTTIEFRSDKRVPYQLDGDYGGHLPLKIEVLPARVQLLLPPGTR